MSAPLDRLKHHVSGAIARGEAVAIAGVDSKFVVTVENMGNKFWLKGTTWAFSQERADIFETEAAAKASAAKAEKFMVPAIKRRYRVEPLGSLPIL